MSDEICRAIETAFLNAVATSNVGDVKLESVAAEAGVSLAEVRRLYDGPFDIFAVFARRIDVEVLAGIDPSLGGEPVRERLFDALMRRFDLLAPHRAGLKGLARAARRDPVWALHLVRLVIGSQAWLLQSAGIATGGVLGRAKVVASAAALARVVPVFLDDGEAGLAKTMAAVDAALGRLDAAQARVRDLRARLWSPCGGRRRTGATGDGAAGSNVAGSNAAADEAAATAG